MTLFLTLVILAAATCAGAWWMSHARALANDRAAPPVQRRPSTAGIAGTRTAPSSAPAPKADRLAALEWNAALPRAPGIAPDSKPARIRDRYIAARFPGVLRGSADLGEIEYVIKVARHYFEEGRLENAAELFALAIQQVPAAPTLRLAQLEIAYLARDAELFSRLARALRAAMPALPEWDEVIRLGRALAPDDPFFGSEDPTDAAGQYGPWPDMPNWIQASWDLTGEVLAADFHRAMADCAAASSQAQCRVA